MRIKNCKHKTFVWKSYHIVNKCQKNKWVLKSTKCAFYNFICIIFFLLVNLKSTLFCTFVIISTPSYSTYLRFWWGFPPFLGSLLLQPHEVECARTCPPGLRRLPIPRGIWPHQCAKYDKPVDRNQVLNINNIIRNH